MNEENILEGLRERLNYIDEELSRAYYTLEEVGAEVSKLRDQRDDIIHEIKEYEEEITEIDKKEEQEEIDEFECKIKCVYHKDPAKCEKKDKNRCPYTQQQLKLEKWVKL